MDSWNSDWASCWNNSPVVDLGSALLSTGDRVDVVQSPKGLDNIDLVRIPCCSGICRDGISKCLDSRNSFIDCCSILTEDSMDMDEMVSLRHVLCESHFLHDGDSLVATGDSGTDSCDKEKHHDPAKVRGFIILSILWLLLNVGEMLKGRRPKKPNFWELCIAVPVLSGGDDFRLGKERGGPQIFGGNHNDDSGCNKGLSPIFSVRMRMVNGKPTRVGWTLRRPTEYRFGPRKSFAGFGTERDTPSPL